MFIIVEQERGLIKIINNITRGPVRKIVSERQMIYRPAEGWSYAHHSFITFFKGRFYAIWSCGTADEDYFGQRVMIAESDDFANWSQPYWQTLQIHQTPTRYILHAACIATTARYMRILGIIPMICPISKQTLQNHT